MNLDLGNTIWLNVSRKLLSYREYFFEKWDDLPREVQEEFKRHSHTHPSVTVTSSTTAHHNPCYTEFTACGNPDEMSHRHAISFGDADSHSHSNVVLSFGAADLGSPWYNHVHSISLTSIGAAGASHTHTTGVNTTVAGCLYLSCNVVANRHYHVTSGFVIGSGGGSHTHTLPTANTGNANSGQTPESHQHPFSVTFDLGGSHTHSASGTVNNATCYYGYDHGHTSPTATETDLHQHTASGNTGLGGEPPTPPPFAPVARPIMKIDLGPHPRSRLLFTRLLRLGAKWDTWDPLWVAVL